jgi:hypothetical protein
MGFRLCQNVKNITDIFLLEDVIPFHFRQVRKAEEGLESFENVLGG